LAHGNVSERKRAFVIAIPARHRQASILADCLEKKRK
jgi:hypothetical protein